MMQKFSYFFFFFLCFSLNTFLNAQQPQQNDSLAKYSYEELNKIILKNESSNIEIRDLLVNEYLIRAKETKDTLKIAEGYFLSAIYSNDSLGLKYSDSILNITKNIKGHKKYPAMGYYFKGYYLYIFGENKKSLDCFLQALNYLNINKNERLELDTRIAITALKANWKTNAEVVKTNEEFMSFLQPLKNKSIQYRGRYLKILNSLSIDYIGVKKYVKSLSNSKIGILETFDTKDTIEYYDFVSSAGTAQYFLGNYQAAIDSSLKALPYRDDHGKAMSNYYLAKSYDKLKQPEKAQFHFLKTDSIYQATEDIFPEMRIAYEHIIDYYKSKNDVENQIKYYDRLIEADAKIDSTYKYVTETIQKKYETPQIIAERAALLEKAQEKENAWKYRFGIISIILVAISGILFYVYRRQKYYKKRFEKLMNSSSEISEKHISTPLNVQKSNEEQKNNIGVPEAIIETILKGLSKFEDSKGFTKQVTLAELAKKLKTNPKYLSKVINWHHQKSYSSYINELRIAYAISKLKEEKTFRNYTIKAIAKEVGFGNAESFSKAFSKTTAINPSYFIKQLIKRLEGS